MNPLFHLKNINIFCNMNNKIPSLTEFSQDVDKYLAEDFYNPFLEDESETDKSPKHVADYGGFFKQRKEAFNLGRVEFSKRPGGDYTIIGKTQFARGEIVEVCPVIITGEIAKTIDRLKDIIFEIDKAKDQWGIVLGYGSLYRHSQTPNLDYAYNPKNKQMYFVTNKFIKLGEELTINYGDDYWAERTNFNTMAEMPNVNQTTTPVANPENESMVQPGAADIDQKKSTLLFAQPNDKANPAVSGIPIKGVGQQ
jgi:uncharacterized protein